MAASSIGGGLAGMARSLPTLSRGFGELFGKAKDQLNQIQKTMASILPAMPGLPVGKFFDLAIGIDIHTTTFPVVPFPLPVPHIGMIFDLMAAIMSAIGSQLPTPPPGDSSLGAVACNLVKGMGPSVKVHGQWIAQAGIPIVHLPGFILHLPFPIVAPFSESEMWMGSSTVLADGGPCSTQFHPALSCSSIGFIPPIRKKGLFKKPAKTLMLPTSLLCIMTSSGKPVLVGGPPTIDLFQLLVKIGIKCLGKLWSKTKLSKMLSDAIDNTPLGKLKKKIDCFLFGEPVDAATGRVYHENVDFELPGPIPLVWSRTYYSDAEVAGPLGYNWHYSYNIGIVDRELFFVLRLADGREIALPKLMEGDTYYNRQEKITWKIDEKGYYYEDASKLLYRFGEIQNRDGYQMLTSIMSKDGFKIEFRYNAKGDLRQIIDSRNNNISVSTDNKGHITCVSVIEGDETINLVRYNYDEDGNMVETLDANDVSKYFKYDGHLLVKLTNQSGMSFYWEYEGEGDNAKCIHTWGDDGILEYWTEYGDGVTRSRNSLGYITEYYYDENKLVYKVVDAEGGVTRQIYNGERELEIVVNPEGYSTKRQYDDFGNITQFTNENEETTNYKYDDKQNLIQVRTPGGRTLSWVYDDLDRVKKRITSTGEVLTYQYEGSLLKSIIDDGGKEFRFEYNDHFDLEELLYPNGLYKSWKYDTSGRTIKIKDPKGNVTLLEYNKVGDVIKMDLPDGNNHVFEYDKSRNLVHAKDNLHDVLFTYGAMGILKNRTQNGRQVNFRYDKELQLRSILNEGKEEYRFELDGLGRVVRETGFDGLRREYIRDGVGQVTKVLRPDDRWTEYMYDGLGNIVHELQYDETETAYKYNSEGLLTEALNKEGIIRFKRDKTGRIIQEEQTGHTIDRKYDKHGECIHISSSLGADISQKYDEEGNLIAIESGEQWQADWKRDNTGLEIFRELSGGISIYTDRDRFGREIRKSVAVRNTESSSKQYRWGLGNRLHSIYNELTGANINFEYDVFDNLIKADYNEFSKQTETIYRTPDAIGNLYESDNRKDRKYGKGGRLLEDETCYYHYDVEGNLCFKEFRQQKGFSSAGKQSIEKKYKIKFKGSATGWLYEWSANGMLSKVVNPQHGKITFGYDALGRRTYKETKHKRTHWLWNGNVPLHEWETHSNESLINIITWIFEGGFVPCAKVTADAAYSIVTDYLGTPTQMYDQTGKNTWTAELDIYGRVRTFKGSSLSDCPFRYQGQYLDEETGLYYNNLRYYDPNQGNYISQDPIRLKGSINIYGYVNDPNIWVDIFGLVKGRMNGATSTVSNGQTSVTLPSKNKVHSEMRGLDALGETGALKGKDVIVSDITGHFQGGVDAPAGMCVKCRTEMFEKLETYGANSVTVPVTKSNQVVGELTIPAENFSKARAELESIRSGGGSNLQKSEAAWGVLEKYSLH